VSPKYLGNFQLNQQNDVMPCSLVEFYRHFGGNYYTHIQGRRIIQAASISLLNLLFDLEDGRSIFLRNAGKILTDYTALLP
jgi:hypothetical protein